MSSSPQPRPLPGSTRRPPPPPLGPAPKRLPRVLTLEECEAMVSASETARDRALVLFLWGSGCRISEATGASLRDWERAQRRCRVRGKGDRERFVQLPERAHLALQHYFNAERSWWPSDSPLFMSTRGGHLDWRSGYKLIQRIGDRAGVEGVHPHLFRHTCATQLLEAGNDLRYVQAYLGHVSGRSTELYTHVAAGSLRDAAASHPMGARGVR